MADRDKRDVELTEREDLVEEGSNESVHFIEDLETRRNGSGTATTLAVGEEEPGPWF